MCRIKTSNISCSTRILVQQQQEQQFEGAVKQSQVQQPVYQKPLQQEPSHEERSDENQVNTEGYFQPHRPEGNAPSTTLKRPMLARRTVSLPTAPHLLPTPAQASVSSSIIKLPGTKKLSSSSKASPVARFPVTERSPLTGKLPPMTNADTSRQHSSDRTVKKLNLPVIKQVAQSTSRLNSDGESKDSDSYSDDDLSGFSSESFETCSSDSIPLGLSTSVTYGGDLQADTSTFINDSILVYQMQDYLDYEDSDDDFGFECHEERKMKPPRLSEQAISEQQALSCTQGNELFDDKINRFLDSLVVNQALT